MPIQSSNPPNIVTLDQWKGLNQQGRRGSIDDQEHWWDENLFPIGPGNLRSCWGPGPAIYTAPSGVQILRIFFGFIGDQTPQFGAPPPGRYGWMFLSNGGIDQVDLDTRQVVHISPTTNLTYNYQIGIVSPPSGTIYQTSSLTQLFVNNIDQSGTDQTTFLNTVDVGSTITANGVTWTVTGVQRTGGETTFEITPAQGAPPGGVTNFAFNSTRAEIWTPIGPQYWASAVVWRPRFFGSVAGQSGGVLFGSPKGLYAWDGTLYSPGDDAPDWLTDLAETDPTAPIPPMPSGLPGIYAMEVYQSRLFVAGKDVVSFSAPSNGADFSTTSGGGSFGYFGNKLTYSFMDLAAAAGYLFVFGDSSIDMISNIQLTGTDTTGFTTNFNYQNVDPQVGHRFPRPVGRIGRYFTMFNGAGIFVLQGGDAQEIGEKLTNIYTTLDTTQYMPTMAAATMFGFRVMLCNGRFTDTFGVTRDLLLMWHPARGTQFWTIATQNLNLTQIGNYEQDSIITPYGTDGASLYQLFAQPDPNLKKIFSSKAIRGQGPSQLMIKNFKRMYLEVHDNLGQGFAMVGTVSSGSGGVPGGVEDVGFDMPAGKRFDILAVPLSGAGIWAAADLVSTSPDFTIERLHVAGEERTLFGA